MSGLGHHNPTWEQILADQQAENRRLRTEADALRARVTQLEQQSSRDERLLAKAPARVSEAEIEAAAKAMYRRKSPDKMTDYDREFVKAILEAAQWVRDHENRRNT